MANGVEKQYRYEDGSSSVDAVQTAAQDFTAILNAPVSKLDADQYSAEDIDGVTEGLLGSGNLNYLMLQRSQTESATQLEHAFDGTFSSVDTSAFSLGIGGQPSALTSSDNDFTGGMVDLSYADAHGRSTQNYAPPIADNADGAAFNTTMGALGASTVAPAAGFERVTATPSGPGDHGGQGNDGLSGISGAHGTHGTNGTDGSSGVNGVDGQDGGGGGIIHIVNNDIDFNFGDINFGDVNLGDIIVNIGDIIDIDIINNILDPILGDGLTIDLEVILSDISELLLSINDITILNEIINLNPVLDIVGDILDLADLITGDLGVHIGLLGGDSYLEPGDYDLLLGGTLNLAGLEIPLLNLDIPLDPLEALLGDIDIDVGAAVGALTGNILGGLGGLGLGLDNGHSADTDLALDLGGLGLPGAPLHIVFDPVEDLVGDLDIGAGLGLDLFGLRGNETSNDAGDSDITLNLGLDILDNTLLDGGLDIPLDPVEALIGDVDLDLTVATDILGQAADGLIDTALGGSGEDTLLSGVGDLAANLVSNILPGMDGDDANDQDVEIGGALDLLGGHAAVPDLDGIVDPLEALTGSDIDLGVVPNITLFGGETDNSAGDTDIDIDLDIGVLGIDLPPLDIEIPLDPVEAIIGDIDFDMEAALDLLNPESLADAVGGLGGGVTGAIDDLLSWPENILPDAGGILAGGALGGDGGLGDVLPDPLGSVVEGLGLLPFAQDNGGGSSGGGLLGGGLFGGGSLFG